ncbi:MAG: S41 family peptidase [Phycisphaerae bacterium]|nr:S41 family peptidase [Phycisphaerae bacterium]
MHASKSMTVVLAFLSVLFLVGQGCPPPASDGLNPDTSGDGGSDSTGDGSSGDGSSGDGSSTDGTSDGSGDTPTTDGDDTTSETLALFDELWNTFDQEYSYFTYKGIDWNDVRSRYRSYFETDLSADAFAQQVGEMIQELHDWHVWVQAPGGDAIGCDETVETNAPARLFMGYTESGAYETLGTNVIYHAWLTGNVAHIVIDTLSTSAFDSVSDADIEALFVTYQSADAMIIDIRDNSGGNENNAIKFASRFVNEPVDYGYVQTRNGPDHDDFDPLITKTLQPSTGTHYDGPVYGLIGQRCLSSAEWFTLMLRAAGATLIGDKTRGGSGNPNTHELANGVQYGVSTWIAYGSAYGIWGYLHTGDDGDDLVEIEDNGIMPDIWLAPGTSVDESNDHVLEAALDDISWGGTDFDDSFEWSL